MELDEFIELVKEQQGIDLSGVLTTADKIDRPERALEKQAIIDFENRNPMAGGGRIGFYKGMGANKAKKKIKLKEPVTLTGKAGDRKLTAKQIDALDPNYLGDFTGGDLERPKKVYKSGTPNSVLDDAIEIRNIIVNNKGNVEHEGITEEDWEQGKEDEKYANDTQWFAEKEFIKPQGVDSSKLVPLLTAALQEAVAKIEALEARVTTLEG